MRDYAPGTVIVTRDRDAWLLGPQSAEHARNAITVAVSPDGVKTVWSTPCRVMTDTVAWSRER